MFAELRIHETRVDYFRRRIFESDNESENKVRRQNWETVRPGDFGDFDARDEKAVNRKQTRMYLVTSRVAAIKPLILGSNHPQTTLKLTRPTNYAI